MGWRPGSRGTVGADEGQEGAPGEVHAEFVTSPCSRLGRATRGWWTARLTAAHFIYLVFSPYGLSLRLRLADPARIEGSDPEGLAALGTADEPAIRALLAAAYPHNFFEARMFGSGLYLGVLRRRELVAMAGLHVQSERCRAAALGNIATHPAHRGRGLGRTVTAALCRRLRAHGIDRIGLNAREANTAARGLWEGLGFVTHRGTRRGWSRCRYTQDRWLSPSAPRMTMPPFTRREAVALLLSAIPTLSLSSLVGCQCDNTGPDGPGDDTDPGDDTERVHPELDADRLRTALTAALGASPWASKLDELVDGATAEIAALREAGYDDSADVATWGLNGVIANVGAAFGEHMALRGDREYDFSAMNEALFTELQESCVAIRGALPGATEEIRGVLSGDTVTSSHEVVQTMTEDEATARSLMHERELDAQPQLNLLLGQLQAARGKAANGFSLAGASAELDSILSGLAPDAAVARWRAHPRRRAPLRAIRPPPPPPPPGVVETACDIQGWISFFVGWMQALHNAGEAALEKMADVLAEVPEALDWVRAAFTRWLAQEFADESAGQLEDLLFDAASGELTELTADQCNWVGAFIVVLLWFVGLASTLWAFAASISWLAGATAGLAGGLVALTFILMLLMILFYTMELMCAVVDILGTVNGMIEGCG
ncbi:MAG: GNAT family N-acetyltransferase [Pseudomonadota bacterium]